MVTFIVKPYTKNGVLGPEDTYQFKADTVAQAIHEASAILVERRDAAESEVCAAITGFTIEYAAIQAGPVTVAL